MSFTGNTKDVLQQVCQFWSMLDDLSENDPAAYRKFTEKQIIEGAKFSSPPELHSCVLTQILEPKTGLLYINICSWKCVSAPQDSSTLLSVCAGKLETGTDENQGRFAVWDVALNPAVLQESNEDKTDKNNVYRLVLSFAQQQHGMRLSQEYKIVNCSPKSSPGDLHRRLGFQMLPNTSKQMETVSQTPDALLRLISSTRSEKQDEVATSQISSKPTKHTKKDLIQVISTAFVEPQKPEYQLEVKTDAAGVPCSVELTVELPKIRSVSECQLSLSKDDVLLEVEDVYYLLLEWPKGVNENTASAIFNKKTQRLRLKVDIL